MEETKMQSGNLQGLITRFPYSLLATLTLSHFCSGESHAAVSSRRPEAPIVSFTWRISRLILLSFLALHLAKTPSFAQNDSPAAGGATATGFPEHGVFEGSAFDSVQMNNGNLH